MSTVLVTGGAGFIGSHLVDSLLMKGNDVAVIDDLSTGKKENLFERKENIDSYIQNRLRFIEASIANADLVDVEVQRSDRVFHLAASVGVENVLRDPAYCIHNNIIGTLNVLRSCWRHHKRVLITSTSEVYGKSPYEYQKETDDPFYGTSENLRWSYAASKYIDELTAMHYYYNRGLEVIIARLFNTIGPRQSADYGMVVPRFVKQALVGEELTLYGDGNQIRTFTSVHDVVWALEKLMEKDSCVGEIFNVGGEVAVSIFYLASRVVMLANKKAGIKLIPYKEVFGDKFEDMKLRRPDTSKLQSAIGFYSMKSLDDMLKEIVECMKT